MSTPSQSRSRARRLILPLCMVSLAIGVSAPATSAATAKTKRVSVHSGGAQGDSSSEESSISASGRFTAYESSASNLVDGDDNGVKDVFVRDRRTGTTTAVSRHTNGTLGNVESEDPAISANGRFVAFESAAGNLVDSDGNGGEEDVFVHDRQTGTTTLLSRHSNGTQGDLSSNDPDISANGRFVAFESRATNLVGGDTNGQRDVFLHDRDTGVTRLISRRSNGTAGNGDSGAPSISADGRFVAFESSASNLVKGDTNAEADVFLHDRKTGKTILVSRRPNGGPGNGDSDDPSISANGRFVAFDSEASNLVRSDTNGHKDVFVFDRATRVVTRVSVRSNGRQGNDQSEDNSISGSGRWVAFEGDASNLVKGDDNAAEDVFLHDRTTGRTIMVSRRSSGPQGNADSVEPALSDDGRWVAFESEATNLVNGDSNGARDIFLRGPLR